MKSLTNRLRRSVFLIPLAAAAGVPACVADRAADPPFEPRAATVLGTAAEVGVRAVPAELTCVSSPLDDEALIPEVLRVSIANGARGGGSVTLARGPQLRSHAGVWAEDAATETRQMKRSADGTLLEQGAHGGLSIQLERDGAVVRGTLVDDQCYQRIETRLTCWNHLELFGSPWAGVQGLLGARFDWTTGTCLDAEGRAALNATPVEVLRETGNGECADLGGVALNGEDFAYPDLDGWILVGAELDGATLSFANLRYASLQGADLSGFDFGYATVEGFIDANTVLPGEGEGCEITTSPWAGDSISCRR